jgi:hypothetical protein
MPRDDGRWFHDSQNIRPSRPHSPQDDPEESIQAPQHWSSVFPLQYSDLLAQGEHLQRDVQATAKENRERGENRANHMHHKSAVTQCNEAARQIWFASVQTIDLKHQYVLAAHRTSNRYRARIDRVSAQVYRNVLYRCFPRVHRSDRHRKLLVHGAVPRIAHCTCINISHRS